MYTYKNIKHAFEIYVNLKKYNLKHFLLIFFLQLYV